jgi:nucleotide-binding universal stress UspA family protein
MSDLSTSPASILRRADARPPAHIAAAVERTPAGRDAALLAATLAHATGADQLLISISVEPFVPYPMPVPMDWVSRERQAGSDGAEVAASLGLDARVVSHPDTLPWRGLRAVVRREHRDLLAVGSAHDAPHGTARLGRHAKELLGHLECPLAVAPRGLADRRPPQLPRIGVGFDGSDRSRAAVALAGAIAACTDAELAVCAVIDEQMLNEAAAAELRHGLAAKDMAVDNRELRVRTIATLRRRAEEAAADTAARARVDVRVGNARHELLAQSRQVDLVVVGSSREAPTGRIEAGPSARAVLRQARCAVILVPRPPATESRTPDDDRSPG